VAPTFASGMLVIRTHVTVALSAFKLEAIIPSYKVMSKGNEVSKTEIDNDGSIGRPSSK
jgi:hypothetical protein